jgi:hypothetical protein
MSVDIGINIGILFVKKRDSLKRNQLLFYKMYIRTLFLDNLLEARWKSM